MLKESDVGTLLIGIHVPSTGTRCMSKDIRHRNQCNTETHTALLHSCDVGNYVVVRVNWSHLPHVEDGKWCSQHSIVSKRTKLCYSLVTVGKDCCCSSNNTNIASNYMSCIKLHLLSKCWPLLLMKFSCYQREIQQE